MVMSSVLVEADEKRRLALGIVGSGEQHVCVWKQPCNPCGKASVLEQALEYGLAFCG